jgi:hypothetical protein
VNYSIILDDELFPSPRVMKLEQLLLSLLRLFTFALGVRLDSPGNVTVDLGTEREACATNS